MDVNNLEGLAALAFQTIILGAGCSMEILQENIAQAFAKKVTSML